MISWMQRHKKWLVITIWISTIAFVGAGFVGWGSYDYGKQGGVVAVVGDREVSVEEYQEEYSNLYEQYARLFGDSFNQEMADKLNLKDVAYKQVLQKNLILSYGDDLGLTVTNEDIAKELVKYQAFLKDGKFDKDTYVKVLSQNRTTPAEFEDSLKRGILLTKIQKLFDLEANKNEVKNLSKLLFLEDDISIEILSLDNITVDAKEDDVKKYWEENKNAYMSEVKYQVMSSKMPLLSSNANDEEIKSYYEKFRLDFKKEDGKIKTLEEARSEVIKQLDEKFTKKEALKKYLKIKKGDEQLKDVATYTVANMPYSSENNQLIVESKVGTLNKPFLENDEFVITQLVKVEKAQPLAYEEAKNMAKEDYIYVEKQKKLEETAKQKVSTFNGVEIKGVTRESIDRITLLQAQEAAQFLNQLFSSTTKEGYIKLNDKVVLYRVNNSKFGTYDETRNSAVESTLTQLQAQELMTNLINRLENSYEIQSSIEVKE
ncbi:peptidylprolyl isomerase [Arcobacter sp. YIC-464]|uniref:peptidylprolyl isomerase n=1 Tax=Arcobacter sp. YIC-464 TaxID=3376631 RepID=UPI003C24BB08